MRSTGWIIGAILATIITWLAAAALFIFLLMGTVMGGDALGSGYADWAAASLWAYLAIASLGPLAGLVIAIVAPGRTLRSCRRSQVWAFSGICASLPLAVLVWLALVLVAVRAGGG